MIFAGKRRAEGAYFLSSLLSPEKKRVVKKHFAVEQILITN